MARTFEEFKVGRTFAGSAKVTSEAEAQAAWKAYQQAASAPKGVVIGHGDAPVMAATNGWRAMRTKNWTPEVNRAWIQGAADAGKPIRLVTPWRELTKVNPFTQELTVTWQEIMWAIARGGTLVGG